LNVSGSPDSEPLPCAISRDNYEMVALLMPKTERVASWIDASGRTVLHLALQMQPLRLSLIHELLSKGVDVTRKDLSGTTALHLAVKQKDVTIVTALLDKGADVNARDDKDRTPLARAHKHPDENVIKLLLSRGAKVYKAPSSTAAATVAPASSINTSISEVSSSLVAVRDYSIAVKKFN